MCDAVLKIVLGHECAVSPSHLMLPGEGWEGMYLFPQRLAQLHSLCLTLNLYNQASLEKKH